jgi:hypothetical protein
MLFFTVDVDWPWAFQFWAGYGALFRDGRPTGMSQMSWGSGYKAIVSGGAHPFSIHI